MNFMKFTGDWHDHYVQSTQVSGFSSSYSLNPVANWQSGSVGHWCGWSADHGGAYLQWDMGTIVEIDSYTFKSDWSCVNGPQEWTIEASVDGSSWLQVDHRSSACDILTWASMNTFRFPQSPPSTCTDVPGWHDGYSSHQHCDFYRNHPSGWCTRSFQEVNPTAYGYPAA